MVLPVKGLPPENGFRRFVTKKWFQRDRDWENTVYPPRTYVFEPIRTYGTFDLALTENVTETTKLR